MVKNIVISHVYSSANKGDAALVSVLIDDLKQAFPNAAITILTLEPSQSGVFEGAAEKASFMHHALNRHKNPLAKLGYALYMMTATLASAFLFRYFGERFYLPEYLREVMNIYQRADLIVPVGGGYIRSRKGWLNRWNIPLVLHPLLVGSILGKPTVLYSQSVGPFQNRFEEFLVGFVLRRMSLILLREDISVQLLASLGVIKNVTRAIDSGFLLRSDKKIALRKQYAIPVKKLLIGVTVRSWLEGEAQAAYEKAVARALDTCVAQDNARIIFIPQVTAAKGDDDRVVSWRVRQLMKHAKAATVIDDELDHHQIKAVYDGLDILLGTRFHSVIFSLTSYVPVVAIEYEHKTSGIMRDLLLEEWVVKIEDVTAQGLVDMLQKIIRKQTSYRTHLRKHVPPYLRKARQTILLLKQEVQG